MKVVRREDEGGRKEKEEEVEKCKVELIVTEKAKEKDDKEAEKNENEVEKGRICTLVSMPPVMPPIVTDHSPSSQGDGIEERGTGTAQSSWNGVPGTFLSW